MIGAGAQQDGAEEPGNEPDAAEDEAAEQCEPHPSSTLRDVAAQREPPAENGQRARARAEDGPERVEPAAQQGRREHQRVGGQREREEAGNGTLPPGVVCGVLDGCVHGHIIGRAGRGTDGRACSAPVGTVARTAASGRLRNPPVDPPQVLRIRRSEAPPEGGLLVTNHQTVKERERRQGERHHRRRAMPEPEPGEHRQPSEIDWIPNPAVRAARNEGSGCVEGGGSAATCGHEPGRTCQHQGAACDHEAHAEGAARRRQQRRSERPELQREPAPAEDKGGHVGQRAQGGPETLHGGSTRNAIFGEAGRRWSDPGGRA